MPHLHDDLLEELDLYIHDALPEGQKFVLVTTDPEPENPAQTDMDLVSNIPPPEVAILLRMVLEAVESGEDPEPPIQYAG